MTSEGASAVVRSEPATGARGEPLCGRDPELATIGAAIATVTAGRGQLLVLVGEAGIGKTRLADAACVLAQSRGFRASWGRCWEAGGAPPFWPVTEALENLVSAGGEIVDDPRCAPLRAHVATIVPSLAEPGARPPIVDAASAEAARFASFRAVVELLERLSQSAPLALVFDDLHIADRASLELLHFVARSIRRLNILLVVAYRDLEARLDTERRDILAQISREGTTLLLPRLDRAASDSLVEAIVGAPAAELSATVHRAAQGNPLFIGELSRWFRAHSARQGTADGVPVPDGVREVIDRRLRQLSAAVRECLEVASAIGRTFSVALLSNVARSDPEVVRRLLADAVDLGVVRVTDGDAAAFNHILIREALYRGLSRSERAALHARIATCLEGNRSSGAVSATIAHHWTEAIPIAGLSPAVAAAIEASAFDANRLAFRDASDLLSRVLAVAEAAGASSHVAELQIALGRIYIAAGQADNARQVCAAAMALADRLGSPTLYADALLTQADVIQVAVVDHSLISLLRDALDRLGDGDLVLRARLMARLASALTPATDPRGPIRMALEATAIARGLENPRDRLEIVFTAMAALMDFHDPWHRAEVNREAEELALRLCDRPKLARIRARLVTDYLEQCDTNAAWASVQAFDDVARELGQPRFLWISSGFQAMRALLEGRWSDADRHHARARELGREVPMARLPLAVQRLQRMFVSTRYDQLDEIVEEVLGAFPRVVAELGMQWVFVAMVHCRRRDLAAAKAVLSQVDHDLILPGGDRALTLPLAEFAVLSGDLERARRAYDKLSTEKERSGHGGMITLCCDGVVRRTLGLLASLLGDHEEANEHFRRGVVKLRAMSARPALAQTLYDWAACGFAWGDRENAERHLAEARALADELDMTGLSDQIAALEVSSQATASRPELASRDLVPPGPPPPAAENDGLSFSLERAGELWLIRSSEGDFHLPDVKGLQFLHHLISQPGRDVHVLDLVTGTGDRRAAGDAGEHLDDTARSQYRSRVDSLREELEEAEAFDDFERASRLREELELLTREIARAFGLGGRKRRAADSSERARTAVQRRLKDAIQRIARQAPRLASHLELSIRTGLFCTYRPAGLDY